MANLPEPSRKRLLSLLLLLRQQEEAFSDKTGGSPAITSRTIARLTGWTDATIRRDISQLGLRCGAAKGYPIGELGEAIEEALDRYCKHSRLTYKGMLVERHMGYHTDFMDQEKAQHARDFAKQLLEAVEG